jgi:hypothetical protein
MIDHGSPTHVDAPRPASWVDLPRPPRIYSVTFHANADVDPDEVVAAFECHTPGGAAILGHDVVGYRHADGQVLPCAPVPKGFTILNNQVIVERGTQEKRDFYIAWSRFIPGLGKMWLPDLDATVYSGERCTGYNCLRRLPAGSRVWHNDLWITVEDFLATV